MPRTANARCAGTTCLGAEPQFECEYGDGWCQTHVLGDPPIGGGFTESPRADFLPSYTVVVPSDLMAAAGLREGDAITHVDGQFPNDMAEFAKMIQGLQSGTVLKVWSGKVRGDVTL